MNLSRIKIPIGVVPPTVLRHVTRFSSTFSFQFNICSTRLTFQFHSQLMNAIIIIKTDSFIFDYRSICLVLTINSEKPTTLFYQIIIQVQKWLTG